MTISQRSLVLLSAGLDSSFNLLKALQETTVVAALTFDYGQRAAAREISCAKKQCDELGVRHIVVPVKWFSEFTKTSLVNTNADLPVADQVDISSQSVSQKTASRVWVPNRNGIFLNIAAGFAEGMNCDFVIPGFNREEATTFPDNSQDFMTALDHSFGFSTANHVRVKCFSVDLEKPAILREALHLKLKIANLWPCYESFEKWCGQCESCLRYKRALASCDVYSADDFLN